MRHLKPDFSRTPSANTRHDAPSLRRWYALIPYHMIHTPGNRPQPWHGHCFCIFRDSERCSALSAPYHMIQTPWKRPQPWHGHCFCILRDSERCFALWAPDAAYPKLQQNTPCDLLNVLRKLSTSSKFAADHSMQALNPPAEPRMPAGFNAELTCCR